MSTPFSPSIPGPFTSPTGTGVSHEWVSLRLSLLAGHGNMEYNHLPWRSRSLSGEMFSPQTCFAYFLLMTVSVVSIALPALLAGNYPSS